MSEERQPPDEEARDAVKRRDVTPLEALSSSLDALGIPYDSNALDSSRAYYELAQIVARRERNGTEQAASLRSALKTAQEEMEALKLEVQRLTERLGAAVEASERMESERDVARHQRDHQQQQRTNWTNEATKLAAERDSLKARLSELEKAEASRQDEVAALKMEVQRLTESNATLRDAIKTWARTENADTQNQLRAEAAERNLKLVADLAVALVGK